MSDLSSERPSISTLSFDDALSLIVTIRSKRRNSIITTAQRKSTSAKPKKTSAEKLVSKLSNDQALELLATLGLDLNNE
tara:strand:+ start:203 stop:439 length:237 start_codon:yes stop_codon:yes gene_type:complete